MADQLKNIGRQKIADESAKLNNLSDYLWANPELAFEEVKAHNLLTDFLKEVGFKVQCNFILPTGFAAVYETAPRPHLVVMCEYDALPEIGHACGHNLIAEVGVAAGLGIREAMEKGQVKGKLTVLGTPAEERGCGKGAFVKAGFFADVDAAILCHPDLINAIHLPHVADQGLRFTFHGRASHAAGAPWDGVNALDACVLAYQSLSCLRQQMRPEWRLHGIITKGGAATNIIPELTEMVFSLRAPLVSQMTTLREKVEACVRGAATAAGCEVTIEESEPFYANIVPNRVLLRLFEANATSLGVVFPGGNELSGSSDVGNVSQACPTIQPLFHIGAESDCHTREFTAATGSQAAQPFVLTQAHAVVGVAVDLLLDHALIEEARSVFDEDMLETR